MALSDPSELKDPCAAILSPTAMLSSVAEAVPRTEYLVVDETSMVTVLPGAVVTTIVEAVLLATVPMTGAGAKNPSRGLPGAPDACGAAANSSDSSDGAYALEPTPRSRPMSKSARHPRSAVCARGSNNQT